MNDFEKLVNFENLYTSHKKCRRGKTWKDSVVQYDIRAMESTYYLENMIEAMDYSLGPYHEFSIMERGKPRRIKATRYVDRVFLQTLSNEVLLPHVAPSFISGNGASRKGCGTDYMRIRFLEDLRDYVNKNGPDGYILIGDFHGYFDSINHEYLNSRYRKWIDDDRILEYIRMIHDSTEGENGLPLGNVTSQVDALLAASELDHYIKERLFIRWYGRYMDDFYLIHKDKDYLYECRDKIGEKAKEPGLEFNKKKTYITTLRHGVNFLGYHYHVSETGKVIVEIIPKKLVKERRKLKKLKGKVDRNELPYEKAHMSYISWRGSHTGRNKDGKRRKFRPNTYYAILSMDIFYGDLFYEYLTDAEKKKLEYLKKRRKLNETK